MRALIVDQDSEVAEAVSLTFGMTWPDSETISLPAVIREYIWLVRNHPTW